MVYAQHDAGRTLLIRVMRTAVPWVGLVVVAVIVWSLLGDYRTAVDSREEQATQTVEATAAAGIASGEPYVKVLSDGLNLRAEPSTSAGILAVLNSEQKMALLEEGTGWYRVRTTDGTEGWVAAGGRYTELVQP